MSYRSKVLALSATLAVLLAIYGAGLLFSPERLSARAEKTSLLQGQASEAASISIGATSGSGARPALDFVKAGGVWVLRDGGNELPVVQPRIDALLASLAGVERLSPRSQSASSLEGFGLGQGKGQRIVVKTSAGTTMADFELGGYGPTGTEVYLRLAGAGTVYAADSGLASSLDKERAAWLDLRLFQPPLKPEEVSSLAVLAALSLDGKAATKASWSARRKDGGWVSASGGKYEAVGVESVLRSILNLEGKDIVARPPVSAFAKVQGRIDLGLEKGGKIALEVGASAGEDSFYLRSTDGPQVYVVSGWSLGNILRTPQAGN